MKLITLFSLLFFLSCKSDKSSSKEENSISPVINDTLTTRFMELVNDHRKSKGLKALIHSERLTDIAFEHSKNMAQKTVPFGHSGFSSRCSEAREVMGGGNLCAENVAMGQKTAEAVFSSWLNSSSHRANIENPRLTHSGLGIATASSGTLYWTHFFLEK